MSSPICQGGDTVVSPFLVASGIRTICQKLRLVNSFWNTVSMFARWCAFLHRLSGAWPWCRGCTAYFPAFLVCLWNHKCLEAEVEYMLSMVVGAKEWKRKGFIVVWSENVTDRCIVKKSTWSVSFYSLILVVFLECDGIGFEECKSHLSAPYWWVDGQCSIFTWFGG